MNIGIYEDHAFLIPNLDKVSKHYACAECQAGFTKVWNKREAIDYVVPNSRATSDVS